MRIEFTGALTGAVEKKFWKLSRYISCQMFLMVLATMAPICIFLSIRYKTWLLALLFVFCVAFILLVVHIPKSQKEKQETVPYRVFTDGEIITSVSIRYNETRHLREVIKVKEYPEFYELVFSFPRISEKFICQKDLLSQGTLEEFETLFNGKIVNYQK